MAHKPKSPPKPVVHQAPKPIALDEAPFPWDQLPRRPPKKKRVRRTTPELPVDQMQETAEAILGIIEPKKP